MIIDNKTIKKRNQKIKQNKKKEKWRRFCLRRQIKKVTKLLRKQYIKTNDVNVELDGNTISFDLIPVLDEMAKNRLISYCFQGAYYRVRILTSDDVFNNQVLDKKQKENKEEEKLEKKSATRADFEDEKGREIVDLNININQDEL